MTGSIGGYFGLEICDHGKHYHEKALKLNTARNCFEYILLSRKYTKVYIPYYTCEVVLEPIKRHRINFEFYSINERLEPVETIRLNRHEAFLYTNYFGLKQSFANNLACIYGENLILDNAQAFFAKPIPNIDTFYSARKFFGVPDGAYLYTNCFLEQELEQDKSYERMSHLLKRVDLTAEDGYTDFVENDASLENNQIRKMSAITDMILKSIDYERVKQIKTDNFKTLHSTLGKNNKLKALCDINCDGAMIYPYLNKRATLKRV